ncbi:MAG: hypothetical protein KME31_21820 [Tolypothrix carrinoi HA7290-LM1]|nr:hypothetical protein [Tolypothrix carrinoi HA7290-LM1]
MVSGPGVQKYDFLFPPHTPHPAPYTLVLVKADFDKSENAARAHLDKKALCCNVIKVLLWRSRSA